jgi:hypothetical protein
MPTNVDLEMTARRALQLLTRVVAYTCKGDTEEVWLKEGAPGYQGQSAELTVERAAALAAKGGPLDADPHKLAVVWAREEPAETEENRPPPAFNKAPVVRRRPTIPRKISAGIVQREVWAETEHELEEDDGKQAFDPLDQGGGPPPVRRTFDNRFVMHLKQGWRTNGHSEAAQGAARPTTAAGLLQLIPCTLSR